MTNGNSGLFKGTIGDRIDRGQEDFTSMEDWKRRLVEEYTQLHDRYEKLRAFNNKREVEGFFEDIKVSPCSPEERKAARKELHVTELLRAQQRTMGEYLHLLELRAELEGIDLVTIL